MKYKKTILIFALIFVAFYGICGACASDANDTVMAGDSQLTDEVMGQSIDMAGEDALNASCGGEIIGVNQQDDEEILGGSSLAFMMLDMAVKTTAEHGTLKLDDDYKYGLLMDHQTLKKIEINKAITIDGKKHTIDGDGDIVIFEINCNDVTLKNINFKNSKSAAIHCTKNVACINIINCTFKDTVGSAVMFDKNAVECMISGCEFKNNNPKTSSYGAVLFNGKATDCNFTDNNFHDNLAVYASAMQFWGDVTNCRISGEFIGKEGAYSEVGGAITFAGKVSGSTIGGHFENNAAQYGGAIFFGDDVSKSTIKGIFEYNEVDGNDKDDEATGGAIFFNSTVSDTTIDGNFISNHARGNDGWAGAIYFCEEVNNIRIYGAFTGNTATNTGGALYFINGIHNSIISANFENNKAHNGGAGAIFAYEISNTTVAGDFRKNSAPQRGGAIYVFDIIADSTISSKFQDNQVSDGYGGAIFAEEVYNTTVTNEFRRNSASRDGGAIYGFSFIDSTISARFEENKALNNSGGALMIGRISNTAITNEFTGNSALEKGGAIYSNNINNSTISAKFIENNVTNATGYGGAIFFSGNNCSISNCVFADNHAKYGIVYYYGGSGISVASRLKINNNIFSDNGCIELFLRENDFTSNVEYNWFANNATNYNKKPNVINVPLETWLFLNSTADFSQYSTYNFIDILFKLYLYNSASGEISEYDNAQFEKCDLKITATTGHVDKNTVKLCETVRYTPPDDKEPGYVTAQIGHAFQKIRINVKGDFDILQELINNAASPVIYLERSYEYNEYDTITEGLVINKTLKINGNGYTIDAKGKSRIFNVSSDNVDVRNITFLNGKTTGNGGAMLICGDNVSVFNCAFVDNSAGRGIIYFDTAGGLHNNLTVNCNIFLNTGFDIYFDETDEASNVDFNWFGNNASNYNAQPRITNVNANNWLFVNSTSNSTIITYFDRLEFLFRLDLYDPASGNVSEYDNSAFEILDLKIAPIRADTDRSYAKLGQTIHLIPTKGGNVSVTAWAGNYCQTIEFFVEKGEFGLLEDLIEDSTSSVINLTRNYTYSEKDWITEGIVINRAITINGNGFTIDAKGKTRIFNVYYGNVVMNDIIFLNGNATDKGGAIRFGEDSYAKLTNCTFKDNQVTADSSFGGAVYMYSGSVENCNFTHNLAEYAAAAIFFYGEGNVANCNFADNHGYNSFGTVLFNVNGNVSNCNFTNNSAGNDECALVLFGEGSITNCNFVNNDGGAIYLNRGNIENCNFTRNRVDREGGAVRMFSGSIENCNFTHNRADYGEGGAVFLEGHSTIKNCNFADNFAQYNGGAIASHFHGYGNVANCNFTNNTACEDAGGAILFSNGGNVSDCNFAFNQAEDGGAIFFRESYSDSDTVTNCNFTNNKATSGYGGAVRVSSGSVEYCNFADNQASYGGGALSISSGSVEYCNFTNNKANSDRAGAIYASSVVVENCNFENNDASTSGGAVYIWSKGNLTNCNFTDNNAASGNGGAVYFNSESTGNFENCNFVGNTASVAGALYCEHSSNMSVKNSNFVNNTVSKSGGAIYFDMYYYDYYDSYYHSWGTVENCNFTNNSASGDGGAIFMDYGTVTNCNFAANNATAYGGAVYFLSQGNVANCNFTDNHATYYGGAVFFNRNGCITNCNFTNNIASTYGGAIYFLTSGTVENCSFVNNTASDSWGGAILMGSGNVTNCNFTNNTGTYGSSIFFTSSGTVENCNFVNNTANGGAIYFSYLGNIENCNFVNNVARYDGGAISLYSGSLTNCNFTNNAASRDGGAVCFRGGSAVSVENCNFTGNNATRGSAIYFSGPDTNTISNSIFLNNRANAEALKIEITDNNIEIDFTGQNNLINAIYSNGDVSFTNVIYWGANGITNTDKSYPSRSNREAGQNITVKALINDNFINMMDTTDDEGKIVLDLKVNGEYFIRAIHYGDSYYTEDEKIKTNMDFYVNVTEMETTNKTVNITAKSNIFNEVMPGNLLFILPGGDEINATYVSDGIWWAVHRFDDYGEYEVNASYIGLDGVALNNATITINKANSTINLDDIVMEYGDSVNVTVKTKGATAVTAKIGDDDVGVVDNYTVQVSGLNVGNYTLTVTTVPDDDHYSVSKKVNVTVNRANSTVAIEDIVFDYNTTGSAEISVTGATDINAKIIGHDEAIVNVTGNTISISNLTVGNYTLTVTTVPDANHNPVTKTFNVTVKKPDSTLTVSDVTFDYGASGYAFISYTGAIGVTASLVNQPKALVNVNGSKIEVSGLDAGTYVLSVTTIADDYHSSVTENATVIVNKVNSTLTVSDVKMDYGEDKNVTVKTENASAVTAKIDGVNVTVDGFTISIFGLDAGTHILTVTTVVDANHKSVTENATVTVNKVNSTLIVGDVELDYGEAKNVTVKADGATAITAKIDDVDVAVDGFTIQISGLDAGTHTLTVTAIADKNHESVTETATITVNKVNSTLTVSDVELDYGEAKNVTVKAECATGIAAKIDGVNVAVDGFTIRLSGLDAGTHTLTVTVIADKNHESVTETATITVNKVNSTLTVADVELDYGEAKNFTVTADGATGITAKIDDENVTVDGYTIPISGLAIGDHTLIVTTIADDNHNPVTETATITVNKVNSTLTVDDVELDYGEGKNVTVKAEGATGITAKIDGENVTVDGFTVPVSGLDAGTHTLSVTTLVDDGHNPVTRTATITVNKVNSTLTVDDVELDYGEAKNVTVKAEGATGITAKINDVNVTVDGFTVPVSGLDAGTHTLTVTAVVDKNHNPVTQTATITVNKINSTLTVDDIELDYGEFKNVTVKVEGATGITAKIDDVNVTVDGFTVPVIGLDAGTHTLSVTTITDKNHESVTRTATITDNKVNSTLTVVDVVLDYGESKNVTVNSEGASAITAKIDGVNVSVDGFTVPVSNLDAGTHNLTVTSIADKNHNPVTRTVTITVNKVNSTLTVDDIELDYGETKNVTVTSKGATAITAEIDGVNVTVDGFTVPVSALDAGTHTLTVTAVPDANHNPATKTANITVNKVNSTLSVSDIIFDYGSSGSSAVEFKGASNVTATVNDSHAVVQVNGKTITVSNLTAGSYILSVTTVPDDNHNAVTVTAAVTVMKQNSTAEISMPENFTVGENSTVNVVLSTDATGNVTARIDGELTDTSELSNGSATLTIPSLSAGNHTVEISYSGDGKYNPVSETKQITVSKQDSTPEITVPSDITFGHDCALEVTLPGDAGGNVTLVIDGKAVDSVVVTDGSATVELPALAGGNHTAEVIYSGDEKYRSSSKTAVISVERDSTDMTYKNVSKTYDAGDNLVIKLTDSQANPLANAVVTVVLDTAKNYTTDENGQIKISNLLPKTYNARITFAGNENYTASSAEVKVVVKKATPKITAKNKIYKTTAKTKKYTITLKDNKGKPIKKATVTLKVAGNTYRATTDSKGKATFKISKLNRKGTFTATVTFKANKYYKKVTKKVRITVKAGFKTVSRGSHDSQMVKKIQRALKSNGFYLQAYGHYLMVDGIYEQWTENAVMQFQLTHGLKPTGSVNEKTAVKLGII